MLAEQIRQTLRELVDSDAEFLVERAKKPEHGDFASNVAMVVAKKESGLNPRSLAEELQEKLKDDERFTSVEVAGPGFLNFRVAPATWQAALADIIKTKESYGVLPDTGKKIQVEFISANPTGLIHLGNARGGYVGDVLANVLLRAGNTVEREYYINDAGNQIKELGRSIKGEGDQYSGEYIDALRKDVDTNGSPEEIGAAAAAKIVESTKQIIETMGITYDSWFSEQKELRDKDEVNRTLKDLERVDATYEKDGALWLKSTHYDDEKDRVLVKSDGSPTYVAADLAYHYHKFVTRKIDTVINKL